MNDTTQWFSGKRENLLVFSGTVEINHYPTFEQLGPGVYASDEHIKTEMIKVRTTIDFKPAVDVGCYTSKHCPLFLMN